MKRKPNVPPTKALLRRQAEAEIRDQRTYGKDLAQNANSTTDAVRLLHELQVHQVELELQNTELRKTRDDLELALDSYTDLYDFAPVGYFTLAKDGTIRLVNLTGSRMAAIDRARLLGQSFRRLLTAKSRAPFSALLDRVFASHEKQSGEFELLCQNHIPRIVSIEAQFSPTRKECRAAVLDITERKLAEAGTMRLAAIVNSSSDAIVGKDLNSRITSWNDGAEKVFGYSAEEMIGCSVTRLIPADRRQEEELIMNRIRRGESVKHFETIRVVKDGRLVAMSVTVSPIWDGAGKIVGASKVARDITERKAAETALRQSEMLFSVLIEEAPVGVLILDAGFILRKINPVALVDFSRIQPLLGRDFFEIMRVLWPKRVADQIEGRFRVTLETGRPFHEPEFAERRRDTRAKEYYDWQIQRITLSTGQLGLVCFFNNITSRKLTEGAQRDLEVMAASNRRLEDEISRRKLVEKSLKKSEDHQIRLAAQLRQLSHEMLRVQEEERKRISRELHDVVVQTLVSINVHLAALGKKAAGDPRSLGREIVQTQALVEKAAAIVHRFAVELRPTVLDDLGLIPALNNFMTDFMTRTGVRAHLTAYAAVERLPIAKRAVLYRVALEALNNVAVHARASRVEVSIEQRPGAICLKVKDDGRSFDAKRAMLTQGNGRLGLLGMRERLEMIGGQFSVVSLPNEGTTVIAEIPPDKGRIRAGGK